MTDVGGWTKEVGGNLTDLNSERPQRVLWNAPGGVAPGVARHDATTGSADDDGYKKYLKIVFQVQAMHHGHRYSPESAKRLIYE